MYQKARGDTWKLILKMIKMAFLQMQDDLMSSLNEHSQGVFFGRSDGRIFFNNEIIYLNPLGAGEQQQYNFNLLATCQELT